MSGSRACAFATTSALVTLLLSTTPVFAAPAKQECVDAATRGQIQRDDLKLGSAAEAFAVCAAASCPAAVRKSCTQWLEEVKASIPTVSVRMVDARVTPTSIRIDGKDAPIGGTAQPLDPGTHHVRVEAPDKLPFDEDFSLSPKEARTIEVRFPVKYVPPPPMTRPTPTLVWILGGVAIAGTASWATFGLLAKSETDRLSEECAPVCSTDDRNSAFRLAAVADVSLGAAVIAAVAGAVIYFTRPSKPGVAPPSSTSALSASSGRIAF